MRLQEHFISFIGSYLMTHHLEMCGNTTKIYISKSDPLLSDLSIFNQLIMIGGKINLGQLKNVVKEMKGKNGNVKAIILPIAENHLFEGKDGNIYLDIVAFELQNPQHNDTHLIKQSLPKDVREKMSEEEKKSMPILGNLNTNIGGGSSAPVPSATVVSIDDDEDLPF